MSQPPTRWRRFWAPPPPLPPVAAADIPARYRYWRLRQLYASIIGYAAFYLVRKNFPVAMPAMQRALGVTKVDLGLYLTLHDLVYGVSKLSNGVLGDRCNPRVFMTVGLIGSALMNVAFGFSASLTWLGVFWMCSGWFQGMGFPPCARVLSHWFGARERGLMWGIWNCSHQLGGAAISVGAGVLVHHFGWSAAFTLPALAAIVTACFLYNRLRDTPASLGLPSIEQHLGDVPPAPDPQSPIQSAPAALLPFGRLVTEHLIKNPRLWALCMANFFVYLIRYGVMNWAPSYLSQVRGHGIISAGSLVAGFELAGIMGSISAGWLSDRIRRRAPVCIAYMLAAALGLVIFWRLPLWLPTSGFLDGALLLVIGFLIYGPQLLVSVAATDLVGPRAAATAVGFTGIFGYASSAVSGLGFGWVVEHIGWSAGFQILVGSALLGAACFVPLWRSRVVPRVA